MNKTKILYILNVANRVNNFSFSSMIAAQNCNFEFHIAGNWAYENLKEIKEDEEKYGIHIHQIDFRRNPLNPRNIHAYHQLLKLCKNEKFDILHCNTPIGGFLGRLVGSRLKIKKVIYEAHGFHFFKDQFFIKRLIFSSIEKHLAKKTDVLITINKEDFNYANKRMKLRKNGYVANVPGVGINLNDFKRDLVSRNKSREELGLGRDDVALASVGELNKNKNCLICLRALNKIHSNHIKFYIFGNGRLERKLKRYVAKHCLDNKVEFMGFKNNLNYFLNGMDLFVSSSKREGLPRSVMEAMAVGLPCVVSNVRGNNDLIVDGKGGFLCKSTSYVEYKECFEKLSYNQNLRNTMGDYNHQSIKSFDLQKIISSTVDIYKNLV